MCFCWWRWSSHEGERRSRCLEASLSQSIFSAIPKQPSQTSKALLNSLPLWWAGSSLQVLMFKASINPGGIRWSFLKAWPGFLSCACPKIIGYHYGGYWTCPPSIRFTTWVSGRASISESLTPTKYLATHKKISSSRLKQSCQAPT